MSEFNYTGRVWRSDPKYKGTKLAFYDVSLKKLGGNWITEGGTIFGGTSGKPKVGTDRLLNVNSIKQLNE